MSVTKRIRIPRVRYTVEVTDKIDKQLEAIAAERDTSKAELIRTAAKLITEWDRLEREGFSVGGWKPNDSGGVDTERLLLPN